VLNYIFVFFSCFARYQKDVYFVTFGNKSISKPTNQPVINNRIVIISISQITVTKYVRKFKTYLKVNIKYEFDGM